MAKTKRADVETAEDIIYRIEVGRRLYMARMLIDENRTRMAQSFQIGGRPMYHTTWRMWEKGQFLPNVRVMAEFCRRYKITTDWIYLGALETLPEGFKRRMYKAYPELLEQSGENPGNQSAMTEKDSPAQALAAPPMAPERGRRKRGTVNKGASQCSKH